MSSGLSSLLGAEGAWEAAAGSPKAVHKRLSAESRDGVGIDTSGSVGNNMKQI